MNPTDNSMYRTTWLAALVLLTFGSIGHFWHKYFTEVGQARTDDFGSYASGHWYFWVAIVAGFWFLYVSILIEKRSTPRPPEDNGEKMK